MFKKYYCIKQNSTEENIFACLAILCKQIQKNTSINRIKDIAKDYKLKNNEEDIIEISKKLKISVREIQSENFKKKYTSNIQFPAIVSMIDGSKKQYIIIHKVARKYVLIANPIKGEIIRWKKDEFFQNISDTILVFSKIDKQNYKSKGLTKKIYELIKLQKKILIGIFFSSILITTFGIIGSFYFKFLLNTIIPRNLESTLNTFSIGLVILTLFSVITSIFRGQLLIYFYQKIDFSLMLGYYEHIINLPMKFFSEKTIGDIISRLDDGYKIRMAISRATLTIMIDGSMAIIGGVVLYQESSFLFYITLIPLILYLIIVITFKKIIASSNREMMQSQSSLTAYVIQCLRGIETIKAFNGENEIEMNIEKNFVDFIDSSFKLRTINNLQQRLKVGVKSIFGIVILWIGTVQVLKGNITVGTLLTFNALLVYFLRPIENIVNFQSVLQSAIVAAQRLEEIIGTEIEKNFECCKKISMENLKGNIEFKDVDFGYRKNQKILEKINIEISGNSKIALVGKSGSGKTTFSKLLMHFYKIDKGKITINNIDIKDIDLDCLRNKISYVSQETFLFNKNIYDNLTIGLRHISNEQIIDACKKAQIHEYINSLPQKYKTVIKENGANLSGGQKQRLAIARAIIKNPDILIMDEATSNLDSITEKAVSDMMNEFMKDKTAIIIAHRLSTIKKCEKIYVLDKGKIIESGNHRELLEKESYYKKLWKEQVLNQRNQKNDFNYEG